MFKHQNGPDSRTYYPLTEFVETDDGRFAAAVPSPRRPRAQLKDGARLPNHIDPAHIARTDTLFRSIHSGSSLRYVVDRDDEVSMVQHAYWVATLRHRI